MSLCVGVSVCWCLGVSVSCALVSWCLCIAQMQTFFLSFFRVASKWLRCSGARDASPIKRLMYMDVFFMRFLLAALYKKEQQRTTTAQISSSSRSSRFSISANKIHNACQTRRCNLLEQPRTLCRISIRDQAASHCSQ